MLKKYNDTPAAIALALFTLGGAFYVAQLLFMTEAWLAENGMGVESVVLGPCPRLYLAWHCRRPDPNLYQWP